jgi:hypothetical protein
MFLRNSFIIHVHIFIFPSKNEKRGKKKIYFLAFELLG